MAESDSTRLARGLHQVAALTQRILEERLAEEATGDGVTFPQIAILKWLDKAGPRRSQHVARFISASAPAATQMLRRLKAKGLVKSSRDPKDRRAESLTVTPKARAMIRRYEDSKERRLHVLLDHIPAEQRQAMIRGLEAAIAVLLKDGPNVADMCLHCGVYESPTCIMKLHGHSCPTTV